MIDYSQFPERQILCIDMKSFYASVAAVDLGLDPLTCYLAVVGSTERQGSVVLAASPRLKKEFGIKTTNRLFEIPNDPRIKVVNPKMGLFIKVSTEITKLFYRYVPPNAVHTYSVDESFLNVKGLEKIWGDPETIASKIQADIQHDFGLPCTVGIGPNMLIAKLALDLESKKAPNGIAKWSYEDIPKKLWPISPLSEMWGIGRRVEKTLHGMGIFNVGQLANYPLELLEKKFGVMGNQLYHHAWGVDLSEIGAPIMEGQISFGKSQILMRDYKEEYEIKAVVLEMCEEVAKRARDSRKIGRTISFGLGYSKDEFGGGFHRSRTIENPTNVTMDIYNVCLQLMKENYSGQTVRSVSLSITKLVDDYEMQLDLFDVNGWKKREIGYTVDKIRNKYGAAAILRAVSFTGAGTALHRSKLVGGHKE
ncbi:DNA polymerase thumb domain-containing protein [Cytobacillus praedii]|uniref:UV damage repair protein UvrX n=1 Tax=Cytobacillus praedii TaxID=1742358 RepID=A0A4R1AXN8_9BACI|nr:UV damage repair protein UvrX [Cytobacillus praedii]TCJ01970.1 UV damage repair protein UvrX [Cytobacillus praedii]